MKNRRIIDSHCHIYPEKIAAKAVARTDGFYGAKSECDGSAAKLLSEGTRAGIGHFIVCSVATTPHQVAAINEFIADEVQKSAGLFTGLGTLHPESDDIERDFLQLLGLGLKGVKLHPEIQGFKLDDYRCLKIYELCEKHAVPVLLHTGDSRYDLSNPNRLKPILDIYESLTVIGAHFGGYSIWEQAAEELHNYKNLYVDCSSSLPFLDEATVTKLIRLYGADRVLFGTDYPMWTPSKELERFLALPLTEQEREMIFFENAAKLFDICL